MCTGKAGQFFQSHISFVGFDLVLLKFHIRQHNYGKISFLDMSDNSTFSSPEPKAHR